MMPTAPLDSMAGNEPGKLTALTDEHRRLQGLVSELLAVNQALRFQLAQLEESAERGLTNAADGVRCRLYTEGDEHVSSSG